MTFPLNYQKAEATHISRNYHEAIAIGEETLEALGDQEVLIKKPVRRR